MGAVCGDGTTDSAEQNQRDHTQRSREKTGREAKPVCCIERNSGLYAFARADVRCRRGAFPGLAHQQWL